MQGTAEDKKMLWEVLTTTTNYFENQESVSKNLISFMREKGYSRSSLSKLSGISRPAIDQILSAQNTDVSIYYLQLEQINQVFEFPEEYLIRRTETSLLRPTSIVAEERSEFVQELFDGLDNILDVYSMYLNED